MLPFSISRKTSRVLSPMELITLSIIAAFILGYGLVSQRLQHTIISAPMAFTAFGLLLSERGLALIDAHLALEIFHFVAELTLILLLFSDASRISIKLLRKEHIIPIRLLAIGLPLTAILGTLLALLMPFGFSFWEAAILAVILAPTDAALGQAVVSLPIVPIRIRQALNVESGLNDGLALPLLLLCIFLAGMPEEGQVGFWLQFASFQLVLGPIVGVAVAYLGGKLITWAERNHYISSAFIRLSGLGLALLAFSAAELVGGNGFIAAFCAGLTLGNTARNICNSLYEFAEAEGQLLTLLTFMFFGSIMLVPALEHLNPTILIYGVLSLTIVRILPVALSLIGLGLNFGSVLFIGWFGPRGVASILYVLLLLEESSVAGQNSIVNVVVITVFLSIIAHGVSAIPLSKTYSKRLDSAKHKEHEEVTEMPVRLPFRDMK